MNTIATINDASANSADFQQTENDLTMIEPSAASNSDAFANKTKLQKKALNWIVTEPKTEKDMKKHVSAGVKILNGLNSAHLQFQKKTGMELVKQSILIGQICNKLKEQVKKPGQTWGMWVAENMKNGIEKRSLQKYMRIAAFPDAEQHAFLGIDRLDYLCTVINEESEDSVDEESDNPFDKSKDPVGYLFNRHHITKCSPEDLDGFKKCIDICIACEKLKKAGIEYDSDHVELLINGSKDDDDENNKFKFSKSVINELKTVKKAGEDTKQYIKKLALNKGKLAASDKDIHITLHDFNSLGERMIKVINVMLTKIDITTTIDKKILNDVEAKINELKAIAGIA